MGGDRELFSALSARGPVARELTDAAWLQALLDVEAGLARALAHARIVPLSAAQVVTAEARAEHFSVRELAASVAGPGNPVPALVKALGARVAHVSEPASAAVHHGATSQDIVDSAVMLLFARATPHLAAELAQCAAACARLARQHRGSLMLGRTLLQQATPISFGLKAAGYLHALDGARARLAGLCRSQLQAQLGGASGTLSVLGEHGVTVLIAFARELGLSEPVLPWHTSRGPIVEWAGGLGLCAAALGKIARDVTLLAQSELDEVQEPAAPGRGGSSTMPHKQNPVGAIAVLSCTRRTPGLVATLLACAEQEHERAAGAWHAEWETATELLRLVGSAASWLREVLEGLSVNSERMLQNLQGAHDFPMAERLSSALSPRLGRQAAQREVQSAVRRAADSGVSLGELLRTEPEGRALMARAELDDTALAELLDPRGYLGSAELFIERALAAHDKLEHEL